MTFVALPGREDGGPEPNAFTHTGASVVHGPGLLFVVSGPSGAGKDTLVDALRARMARLRYSVSATTRAPRDGEVEGEHYFFLDREEFLRRREGSGFLEWREYNDNLYGTPRDFVERTLAEGWDLIMKPEVNGALAIKETFPDAVLIFLLPDKFSHLRATHGDERGDRRTPGHRAQRSPVHPELRLHRDQRTAAVGRRRPRPGSHPQRGALPHPSLRR